MSVPSRRHAAFHQAGHGVAAILVGGRIERIQLSGGKPILDELGRDITADVAGYTGTWPKLQQPASTRMMLEPVKGATPQVMRGIRDELWARILNDAFVIGAGRVAEAHLRRTRLLGGWDEAGQSADVILAQTLLEPLIGDAAARLALIRDVWRQSEPLLTAPAAWAAITAVADAVLGGVEDGKALTALARGHLPEAPRRPLSFPPARAIIPATVDQTERAAPKP